MRSLEEQAWKQRIDVNKRALIGGQKMRGSKLVVLKVSQFVLIATRARSELHRELTRGSPRAHSKTLQRARRMAAYAGGPFSVNTVASESPQRQLDGATVIFPDMDSSAVSDLEELRRLRGLGVKTIVTSRAGNEDVFVRLELRNFSRLRRLLNVSYLWLHAVARFGYPGSRFGRLFSVKPYHVRGKRWETPPLKAVRREEDELCQSFALVEGITQMPPLPVMHRDIERRGGGRYSVWNGRVLFSPLADGRRPFALIPRNRWTEPFLEFVSESSSHNGAERADFVRDVERAAERWRRTTGGNQALRPGDRLVILTHCLAPGGAERQWCYLAMGLKRLGYDVSVVATHDVSGAGSHYLPMLERHAIPFLALDDEDADRASGAHEDPGMERLIFEQGHFAGCNLEVLTRLLIRLKPQAVLAQLDVPNILGAIAAHAAGVPRIVLSFRNYNPSHFPYIYQEWMRPCYRAIASSARVAFTGNSQAANLDYASWIGIAPSRVHMVPNAIDPSDHQDPGAEKHRLLRSSLGLEEGAPVLIGIFRLSDEKRPFDFLEVCRRVRHALPRLQVLIVGEGPQESKLAEAIRAMQLETCVQLLGRRTDIEALLHVSNTLLLTSAHEGMPNVVMEAQLAAVPVVASRTGGVPDCVAEGATAVLVEPGDLAAFSSACIRILSSPEEARSMGALGAELMRRDFTIENMCSRYLQVLAQLDGGKAGTVAATHDASAVRLPIRPLTQELRG